MLTITPSVLVAPARIRTEVVGFKVQSANHYTTGAGAICSRDTLGGKNFKTDPKNRFSNLPGSFFNHSAKLET